ncbi:MAG: hypothetical protein ABIO79_13990 [Ferruginibacter sp.]
MTNKIKIALTALTGILLITSCYKREDSITKLQTDPGLNLAYIKFINVYTAPSPSAASPAAGPTVNVFVNNVKVNAAAVAYGGVFPAAPAYAGITPGLAVNIKVVLNRTTGTALPSDTISNKNYDLGSNTYTTFYLADTIPNPTPDNTYILPYIEQVTNAQIRYFKARFVNMIPSLDTLEVFSKRLNAVIFKGTLFKNASDIIEIPTFTLTDTLQLRKVSAPATVLAQTLPTVFFPTSARVYTVYCYGNITGVPKTRVLTFFTNR